MRFDISLSEHDESLLEITVQWASEDGLGGHFTVQPFAPQEQIEAMVTVDYYKALDALDGAKLREKRVDSRWRTQ